MLVKSAHTREKLSTYFPETGPHGYTVISKSSSEGFSIQGSASTTGTSSVEEDVKADSKTQLKGSSGTNTTIRSSHSVINMTNTASTNSATLQSKNSSTTHISQDKYIFGHEPSPLDVPLALAKTEAMENSERIGRERNNIHDYQTIVEMKTQSQHVAGGNIGSVHVDELAAINNEGKVKVENKNEIEGQGQNVSDSSSEEVFVEASEEMPLIPKETAIVDFYGVEDVHGRSHSALTGGLSHSKPALESHHRHSIMTAATDRSHYKFQDMETIKIPDRYQRAELDTTGFSTDTKVQRRMSRQGKSSSFISAKGSHKVDIYNIPVGISTAKSIAAHRIHQAAPEKSQSGRRNFLFESDKEQVYDLITGIRSSVSKHSKAPPKLNDTHFKEQSKLVFNREGNNQAPPTKYEFKFKDYAPEVFRSLRTTFGISPTEYLMSFQDDIGVKQYGSSGKSGSCFYYSSDQRFIIKTVHHAEHLHLRKILKDYYNHVKDNTNTFLCQFYGLHRLKIPTPASSQKIYILVMNNIFPPNKKMHKTYDIKGSTSGRRNTKPGGCGKDLNWLEDNAKLFLNEEKATQLLSQLRKDISLLERLNIMDYSLLVGFHEVLKGRDEFRDLSKALAPIKISCKAASIEAGNDCPNEAITIDEEDWSWYYDHPYSGLERNTILDCAGGLRSHPLSQFHSKVQTSDDLTDTIYYIGVIDCLTNYSTLKRLETFFRSLKHKREHISAVPPTEYGERFLKFVFEGIEIPTGKKEKAGLMKRIGKKLKIN